jgi:hypothetical protein
VLVFSQWTSMLDLLEVPLRARGIGYRRLDGTMAVPQRERAVLDFEAQEGVLVLLVSLKAAALGLNLVSANHVVLMDLWWNPTVEVRGGVRSGPSLVPPLGCGVAMAFGSGVVLGEGRQGWAPPRRAVEAAARRRNGQFDRAKTHPARGPASAVAAPPHLGPRPTPRPTPPTADRCPASSKRCHRKPFFTPRRLPPRLAGASN